MNKTTVQNILNSIWEKGGQFLIITDIASGRGINGVTYAKYNEMMVGDSRYESERGRFSVLSFEDEHLVLRYTPYNRYAQSEVYLPYTSIKSIECQYGTEYDYKLRGPLA